MFGKSKVFQLYNASITPETVRQAVMCFLEDNKGFEEVSATRNVITGICGIQAKLKSSTFTFKEALGLELGVSVEISLMKDNSLKVSVDTGDTSAHDMTVADAAPIHAARYWETQFLYNSVANLLEGVITSVRHNLPHHEGAF